MIELLVFISGLILVIAYLTRTNTQPSFPNHKGIYHQEIRSDTVTISQEIPFQKKYIIEYYKDGKSTHESHAKISYNCRVLGNNKVIDGAVFSIKIKLLNNVRASKMNLNDINYVDNALRLFSDEDAKVYATLFNNLSLIIQKHGNQTDKDRIQMLQNYDIRKTLTSARNKKMERK